MDCIFCKIVKGEIPSYKIYEDENVLAFLDINPVSVGHTLIIPKNHTLDLETIEEEEINRIMICAKKISKLLMEKLGAQGYSLTQNNGIAQEVKHYHLHIIPRYQKKQNLSVEEAFEKITK